MIKVSVEVGSGIACFRVAVRAASIVQTRYPGGDVRVVFPLDPGTPSVKDPLAAVGPVELEMPESIAG